MDWAIWPGLATGCSGCNKLQNTCPTYTRSRHASVKFICSDYAALGASAMRLRLVSAGNGLSIVSWIHRAAAGSRSS